MKFRSILLAEARGSMAGATFSRNGNSAYVRARATPVNPRTPGQTVARDSLNEVSTQWRSLTQAERTRWIDLAKTVPYVNSLGESAFYSGFQLFMKCNLTLLGIGVDMIRYAPATPPTFEGVGVSGLVSEQDAIVPGNFSLNYTFSPIPVDPDMTLVFDGTNTMSAGKAFVAKSQYRFLGLKPVSGAGGVAPLDPEWTGVFGTPTGNVIGTRINVRARYVHLPSGFASPWIELTTIVAEA